jgi:hypothetical protein
MLNKQNGEIEDFMSAEEVGERGMVVDEYGAVYEFQNEENGDFENPYCNEEGLHYHLLKQSKVAYVNTNVSYLWPSNWSLDELLSRSLPHEAIYDKKNLEHNSEITTNDKGERIISINMVLEYAFPITFTPRKISAKINEIAPAHPFEITHIQVSDMVENGYDGNYANQYTFTQVSDINGEPSITDIHCTAFSYKDACKQVLDGIENQDESLSSTTFSTKPNPEQIERYKKLTLTKFDSATHQPEIVILPDSGKVIDEWGFIYDTDNLELIERRSINFLTKGFEDALSKKDLEMLVNRRSQIIAGITNIFLENHPDTHVSARKEFIEILEIPMNERGYTKSDFGLWVYNNIIPDTDKLTSYLMWSEESYNEKTNFSKHRNHSKIKSM